MVQALQSVVAEKNFWLIWNMSPSVHTLEISRCITLDKYLPKRQHFIYRGNKPSPRRPQIQNCLSKTTEKWTSKPIKSDKDKQNIIHMVDRAVEICDKRILLEQATIPSFPKNIVSTLRPDKNQVIADQRSRFSMWALVDSCYKCFLRMILIVW